MQLKHAILAGAMAALAFMAVPARATHSDAQKTGEQPTSSPCSARQQTADGTWTQLPCRELGTPEQTPRKSATGSPDRQTR
jgi:invasion protein IalB